MSKYSHKPEKSKYLLTLANLAKYQSPLKRSLSGYEIEMPILTETGDISNESDLIISECRKMDKKFPVKEEVGENMIEVLALPHSKVQKTALYLIDNIEQVMNVCERNNLQLLPLGTYPGMFKEKLRKKKRYNYSAYFIGKENYRYYFPRCFGFHYHYTMPRGVFNTKTKFLNQKFHSRITSTLLGSYNFLIASDPVLTTLTQSSPFAERRYYAKDTRMLFWRGGKRLKYRGVFHNLQLLGGLQPYKHTLTDLIQTLNRKDQKVKNLLKQYGAPDSFISRKQKLDLMWNPIKVNRKGTLEQRGLDTCHIDICLAVSIMLKFNLRAIQQEFYHVIPSDIGMEEPFKLEGNVIFIPSQTHVRNNLQYKSAYDGLSDNEILNYCSRFYQLARKLTYKEYISALKPIREMLNTKETISDRIIKHVRKRGYTEKDLIPQDVCRDVSLRHARRMRKNIDKVKSMYENLE